MVIRGETLQLIKEAYRVLRLYWPMTQSQIYTQMIKKGALSNTLEGHKILTDALLRARLEGLIPWDWIKNEDEDWAG